MNIILKNTYYFYKKTYNVIFPRFLRLRLDAEGYSIYNFLEFCSKKVRKSDRVLDAGAGSRGNEKYFRHAKYESTDFENIFNKEAKGLHDFICNLESIPKKNNTYDVIINTQVLEHVENPQQVINELHRILKPKGKLFLTAPQGWGVHGEPYHFFNFTKYGLKSLFEKAGFKIVFIKPRGGMFWYLGKRIKTLPSYIMQQYLFRKNKKGKIELKIKIGFIFLLPFYLISLPFLCFLIPLVFFYLDWLDIKKDYTLGYACYCIKK